MDIKVYNVYCKLENFTTPELNKLRKKFVMYAPGYMHTKKFKERRWNGKVCLLQQREVLTGLLPIVVETFPHANIIDMRGIVTPQLHPTTVPLRLYQKDAVKAAFSNTLYGTWWPRGVIKIGTGGGKTEVAASMIEQTQVKTLFLVHRAELVDQAIERFAKYGVYAGRLTAGKMELHKQVVVATIQSLMSFKHKVNKTDKRTDEQVVEIKRKKAARGKVICRYLESVEQVFVDEAHLVAATIDKGNLFTQALRFMPNAYMRWGLTATPFMREQYHDWLLEGATGGILYDKPSKELVDEGFLAKPKITMYRVQAKNYGDWKDDYDHSIVLNDRRNDKIIECIQNRPGPTMILVQRIAHGNLLKHMCDKLNIPVRFLHGEISIEERQQALQDLKTQLIKAVIGSTIWDEGLDITEILTLIIAGGGRSKIKSLQRLGRSLRLSTGKDTVEVIDFYEEGSKWLKRHAVERLKTWKAEGHDVELS